MWGSFSRKSLRYFSARTLYVISWGLELLLHSSCLGSIYLQFLLCLVRRPNLFCLYSRPKHSHFQSEFRRRLAVSVILESYPIALKCFQASSFCFCPVHFLLLGEL